MKPAPPSLFPPPAGIFLPSPGYHGTYKASCVAVNDACQDLPSASCASVPSCTLISACATNTCASGDVCCGLSPDSCASNPVCRRSSGCNPQYNDCAFQSTVSACSTKAYCSWSPAEQVGRPSVTSGPRSVWVSKWNKQPGVHCCE